MNLFEEAANFMAKHPKTNSMDTFLQTQESKEKFIQELKMIYENATNNEIEKALEWALSQENSPYEKQHILKLIRPKLED